VAQARRIWFATTVSLSQRNSIYSAQSKYPRWGAALPGTESSIPMIDHYSRTSKPSDKNV
jgi:hypothetical protein